MKAKDIRDFNTEELKEKLETLRKELFDLRFKRVSGELKNPLRLRGARREVARVLTVLREKENAEAQKTQKTQKR